MTRMTWPLVQNASTLPSGATFAETAFTQRANNKRTKNIASRRMMSMDMEYRMGLLGNGIQKAGTKPRCVLTNGR